MSRATYIGVDGVARKVRKMYIGVDGVARKVKKAYIGAPNFILRGLPAGYTQVESIRTTGSQYIDTKLSMPKGFRAVFDVKITGSTGAIQTIIGAHDASDPYNRNFFAVNGDGAQWNFGFYGNAIFGKVEQNVRYSIDVCNISGSIFCKINSVAQKFDTSGATSSVRSARTLYLGAMNYPAGLLPSVMQIWPVKIYSSSDDSNLVGDFVPCINPDGAVGMYDMVTNAFFGNAGSGVFTAGDAYKGHVAKLVFEAAAAFNYTGAYTKSSVMLDGTSYNLYTLTGSGTLTIDEDARFWMCSGGKRLGARDGGGGGHVKDGSITKGQWAVTVGATGGKTEITDGVTTHTAICYPPGGEGEVSGGSGGGANAIAYIGEFEGAPGAGDGISTYPFGIVSLGAHCPGGGGGGSISVVDGVPQGGEPGQGGSNGSSGGARGAIASTAIINSYGASGGAHGGGKGGDALYNPNSALPFTLINPSNGSFYGAGGGGSAYGSEYKGGNRNQFKASDMGTGYQGVAYILMPA